MDFWVDGGSFLEAGNMAGGAGRGAPILKNAVLHSVIVSGCSGTLGLLHASFPCGDQAERARLSQDMPFPHGAEA